MLLGIILLAFSFIVSSFITAKITFKKPSQVTSYGVGFTVLLLTMLVLDIGMGVDPDRSTFLAGGVAAMAVLGIHLDIFRNRGRPDSRIY